MSPFHRRTTPAVRLISRSRFIDGVSEEVASPFGDELPTSAREFLSLLPAEGFSCWVRDNSGLVGWGELARLTASGPDRFASLQRQWAELLDGAEIADAVRMDGSGPIAFGTVAFSDSSAETSALVVPRVVLGRRDGRVWMTVVRFEDEDPRASQLPRLEPTPIRPPASASARSGRLSAEAWGGLVDEVAAQLSGSQGQVSGSRAQAAEKTAARIDEGAGGPGGEVREAGKETRGTGEDAQETPRKVVLARDLLVHDSQPFDIRYVLGHLHASYPSCWTFFVDRMLGATPELLVSVSHGRVSSRVLAGTHRSSGDRAADLHDARELFAQVKDSTEHRHAVDSLAASLGPLTESLEVDPQPFLLELANVIHLATDAHGHLAPNADGSLPTALEVAAAVHPTAAVGGTPTGTAMRWIAEREGMDRGRYAGPVGWMDARGDGQWGIALRCGELLDDSTVRVFAGAGIMPQSRADAEVAETRAKFAPMLAALGVDTAADPE